jgi:hypothetical protein
MILKKKPFYILGYLLELIIKVWQLGIFFPHNLANFGSFFSMENPLNKLKSYFWSENLAKKLLVLLLSVWA